MAPCSAAIVLPAPLVVEVQSDRPMAFRSSSSIMGLRRVDNWSLGRVFVIRPSATRPDQAACLPSAAGDLVPGLPVRVASASPIRSAGQGAGPTRSLLSGHCAGSSLSGFHGVAGALARSGAGEVARGFQGLATMACTVRSVRRRRSLMFADPGFGLPANLTSTRPLPRSASVQLPCSSGDSMLRL